ncbi:hypothetical protein GQ53DRAFT_665258 [Thozetella sp. PMI_491]|nr:hypothetical protein GQ53DRAFT_665258 [Thozetella sp. PMI_491]
MLLVVLHLKQQEIFDLVTVIQTDLKQHIDPPWDEHGDAGAPPDFLLTSPTNDSLAAPAAVTIPPPPTAPYSKALVVARIQKEEVGWLNVTLPFKGHGDRDAMKTVAEEWNTFVYTTDDITAEYHTPVNKGHEAMAYLTYIIEHYDKLPDIVVFLHSHRTSWHDNYFNMDTIEMLARLNLDRVAQRGFLNLRCIWEPGCPDHIHPGAKVEYSGTPEMAAFPQAWKELFPLEPPPPRLSAPCCAQFAVTAARVKMLPLTRYIAMRDWILTTDLADSISGRIFEYLYHYIWTGETVLCPEEHECYCLNYGICFASKHQYQQYLSKREEWMWFKARVEEYVDDESNPYSVSELIRLFRGKPKDQAVIASPSVAHTSSEAESTTLEKDTKGKESSETEEKEAHGAASEATTTGEKGTNITSGHDWPVPNVAEMAAKVEELASWLSDSLSKAKDGTQQAKRHRTRKSTT